MKLVVAVIKPFKLAHALSALAQAGIRQVHHCEARGYGRQKDHLAEYKDDRFAVSYLPKVRLEFVCEREQLNAAVQALSAACRTGRQGDGKIWVLDATPPRTA